MRYRKINERTKQKQTDVTRKRNRDKCYENERNECNIIIMEMIICNNVCMCN